MDAEWPTYREAGGPTESYPSPLAPNSGQRQARPSPNSRGGLTDPNEGDEKAYEMPLSGNLSKVLEAYVETLKERLTAAAALSAERAKRRRRLPLFRLWQIGLTPLRPSARSLVASNNGNRGRFPGRLVSLGAGLTRVARWGISGPGMPRPAPR